MIAKELRIDLNLDKITHLIKIKELNEGLQNIDVIARVNNVYPEKEFEKNGKKGKLISVIVSDETGEIRLTLWNKDAEIITEKKVQKGDIILLKNCFVTKWNDRMQLNLSFNGNIELNPEIENTLPKYKKNIKKIVEVEQGERDVNVIGRITKLFPEREFETNERKGKYLNFEIGDSTATINCTAWNDAVKTITKYNIGEGILIESGYTKQGREGIELHLGFNTNVIHTDEELPTLFELETNKTTKKINEVIPGQTANIKSEITEINQGLLRFNTCKKCGSKLNREEEGLVCKEHGTQKEYDIVPVISIKLEDETGIIDAVFYSKQAEKLTKMKTEKLKEKLETATAEMIIEEIKEKIKNKKINALGYVRENNFSGTNEIVIKDFEEIEKI